MTAVMLSPTTHLMVLMGTGDAHRVVSRAYATLERLRERGRWSTARTARFRVSVRYHGTLGTLCGISFLLAARGRSGGDLGDPFRIPDHEGRGIRFQVRESHSNACANLCS